ncbi:hypothetical protein [Synechococcus sp. KORDI-52]|uniref:beta strand repeat-containing protein n=1 Tax=Synechococcus sp. KORDI-52 TaxID=585425 RepID=UPI00138E2BA6|nr:hypothetical protein [Synechococcus sp. KORDI-52]
MASQPTSNASAKNKETHALKDADMTIHGDGILNAFVPEVGTNSVLAHGVNTNGDASAKAKSKASAAIIESDLTSKGDATVNARQQLALIADADTTNGDAIAKAKNDINSEETGGIINSNQNIKGAYVQDVDVKNATSAEATTTSGVSTAKAIEHSTYGVFNSDQRSKSTYDATVINKNSIISDAKTTTGETFSGDSGTNAKSKSGERTGIRFGDAETASAGESIELKTGGDAHISVDVGTADDPNVVSASAKTKGSGDAHASLVTSNNYGITGKSFETKVTPGEPEVLEYEARPSQSTSVNPGTKNRLFIVFDEPYTGDTITLKGIRLADSDPDIANYTFKFKDPSGAEAQPNERPIKITSGGGTAPGPDNDIVLNASIGYTNIKEIKIFGEEDGTNGGDKGSGLLGITFTGPVQVLGDTGEPISVNVVVDGFNATIKGNANIVATVANDYTSSAKTTTGDASASSSTSGRNGQGEVIAIDANAVSVKGTGIIAGSVENHQSTSAKTTTGRAEAESQDGLVKGVRANDLLINETATITGDVKTDVVAKAVTHGGGDAEASANSFNPDAKNSSFGGESVGADIETVVAKQALNINGSVESKFDVDAKNNHGDASASSAELQVTGVLIKDTKGADVDIEGSATVEQDVFAKTVGGGNAEATITSGPDFSETVPLKLDGITGIASTSGINAKGMLNVHGVVEYDGTAVAKNTTGNAKARVGTDDLPLQDMVGTLLVNSGPKSGSAGMHVSGKSTADTVAKATTHSGKAVASVDSDPVKGVKSNAGTLYMSKGDLSVDGDATFTADVDSRSTGSSGSGGKSSASADVSNVVGVDLSQLDSREKASANQLKAAGHIDVDGHVDTTLNAQAVNTTGRSTASTTTSLQKGVLISDNDNSFPPSNDSTVVRGSSVDIEGGVISTSIANAVSHGGGGAFASADAVNPKNVDVRDRNFSTFGGETVGVDVDKVVSKSDLKLNGSVETKYDVDAKNTHGKALASSAALQVTGVLNNVAKGADVDIDGSATVEQDVFAKTVGGGNAKATITSGPDFPSKAPGPKLDGITGIASTSGINAKGTLNVDGVVDYDGTAVAENTTGNAKARVGTDDLPLQDMVGTLLVNSGPKSGSAGMHVSGDSTADTVAKATTHSGKAVASVDSDPVKGVKSNAGTLYMSKGDLSVDGDATFTADVDSRSTGSSGYGGKSSASADVSNVVGVDLSQLDSAPSRFSKKSVPANELKAAGHVEVDGHVDTTLHAQAVNTSGRSIASTTTSLQKGVLISDNDNSFPPSNDSTVVRGGSVDIEGGVTSTSIAEAVSHGGGGAFASADAVNPNNVDVRDRNFSTFGGETVGVDVDKVVSKSDLKLNGSVETKYDVDAKNTHGKALASSAALQVTGVLNNVAKGADVDIDGSATVEQDVFAKTVGGGNAKATITSGPDFPSKAPGPKLDGITGIASTSGINAKGTLNVDGVVDYDGTAVAENTTGNAKARVGTDDLPLQDMVGTLLVNSGPKSGGDMHISGDSTADTVAKATTHSGKAVASVDSDPVKGVKSNTGTIYKSKGDLTVDGDATFTADVDSRSTGSSGYGGKSSASADVSNVVGVDLSQLDSAPPRFSKKSVPANELKAAGHVEVDGHVDTTLHAQAVNTSGRSIASTTTSLQKGVLISDNAAGGPPVNAQQYLIARDVVAPGYGDGSPNETSSPSTVVRGSSVDIEGGVTSTSIANAVSHGGGGAFASADAVNPKNVDVRDRNFSTFGGETVGVDVDKVVSKSDLKLNGSVETKYDVDAKNTHGKALASSAALQVTGVLNNVAKGADVDIDGSATVEQNVFAKTVGGGNAKATITSGPDFPSKAPGPKLDGITGIASTSGINAKGTLNVDGVVEYDGTAVAKNTTGNAKARVGTDDLPLQDMVGTLLVNSGPRSGGDMHIGGVSTAELVADAKTGTGSAKALVNADPVKGVKGNPGVLFRANGDLHVDATAEIIVQANSFAVGGSGERSAANVQTTNVIGFDLSPLDSARSSYEPARANAKGDIHLGGVASADLASDSEITTGNASADVASELVVGVNAQSILSKGSGTISGSAINVSTASSSTTTGKSDASVLNIKTSGISLLSSNDISIKGNGSVEGDGIVSGYSDAYAVTGNATSDAQMSANGIDLGYESQIRIKGEGGVTGKGYVGEPIYEYEDYLVLSPFIISSETTTGNSVSTSDFSASGISGDDLSLVKVSSGDVKGTGAAIVNTSSSTHHGSTSSATSDLSIFGIKNVDNITISSPGAIEGRALGIAETEALNVTGDAHASSTISAIGIDSSTIHSSGEINGVATISQTVTAKTVTGSASARAISGPIIGINSSTINSRGDLTITATASLDTVAYSESI